MYNDFHINEKPTLINLVLDSIDSTSGARPRYILEICGKTTTITLHNVTKRMLKELRDEIDDHLLAK